MSFDRLASMGEEQSVHEIVARHMRPVEADGLKLEFGPDQNGDPALWLVFMLHPKHKVSPAMYEAFHSYAQSVRLDLLKAGVERFPYVRVQRLSPEYTE